MSEKADLDQLYCGHSKDAVAYRLELTRRSKGLDKQGFANLLGLTPGGYSNIISGKNYPSISVVYKACEVFEIDPNWILTGDTSALRHSAAQLLFSLHKEHSRAASMADDKKSSE